MVEIAAIKGLESLKYNPDFELATSFISNLNKDTQIEFPLR